MSMLPSYIVNQYLLEDWQVIIEKLGLNLHPLKAALCNYGSSG